MVEAMMALTLVDHLMMQKAQCELFPNTAAAAERPNPMGTTAHREGGPVEKAFAHSSGGPISERVDEE
jgi:chorismate synthase